MKKFSELVCVNFTSETVKRMDALIKKNKFDSKAQIIRRATEDFLEKNEIPGKVIIA